MTKVTGTVRYTEEKADHENHSYAHVNRDTTGSRYRTRVCMSACIGNINQRMRQVFGDEYALMAETAPGAGMKVILRVPKFFPGVRPDLPKFGEDTEPKASQPT